MARFDCRFVPGESEHSLVSTLEAAAGAAWSGWPEAPELRVAIVQAEVNTWKGRRYSLPEFEPAWWTGEESPLVAGARRALSAAGLDPTPTHYSFCTNGSYLAGVAGIDTIGFGVGEEHIAHQVDEYVTLDSLRAGAHGYAHLARQLLAAAPA